MNSLRDIKQRAANIRSTEQIIRAMYMVASTKLVRARAQLNGVRPIYHETKRIAKELGCQEGAGTHIFYEKRSVKNSLYIVLTSDRGFSGSYNANIIKTVMNHMQEKSEKIIVVGVKGSDYFKKMNKNIIQTARYVPDAQVYYRTEHIVSRLIDSYLSGEAEEVFVAYTRFENVLSYEPVVEQLLPVATGDTGNTYGGDKKFEPDLNALIDHAIPLYLHMSLFRAYSESHTSEQAARMVNMDSAGKNASDLIEELTHMYNRKRQADITQELNEIVGSANILNKGV